MESILLTVHLDLEQEIILEESASKLDAVVIREIPDGNNLAEDVVGSNTVSLTVPGDIDGDDDTISSGEYAVLDWEAARGGDDVFHEVDLELAPLSD